MPVKLYGPRQLQGLIDKFFRLIEPHLDRTDETHVVVGPATLFLEGNIAVEKKEVGAINHALDGIASSFTFARFGIDQKRESHDRKMQGYTQKYSLMYGANGLYNHVFDVILLSLPQVYERFLQELYRIGMRHTLDYAFAHECVHWDLGDTAPARAWRGLPSADKSMSTLAFYGKNFDLLKHREGPGGAKAEIEASSDEAAAIAKRTRLSQRQQLDEGLCYAVEESLSSSLSGGPRTEPPFARYAIKGDATMMQAAYAWAQDQIIKNGIKPTIQRVKAEIDEAFEKDISPVEFLGIR